MKISDTTIATSGASKLSAGLKTAFLTGVGACILSLGTATSAHAQFTIDATDCADLPIENPGTSDEGGTINVDLGDGGVCEIDGAAIIDLNDGQNDTVVNIAAGTQLTALGTDDEEVVIFLDNAEDRLTVNIEEGAVLRGTNGVIYIEGDAATITNSGSLIGTGPQEQGVVYFDRDTDSNQNNLINTGTGRIISQDNGPAIGIEVLLVNDEDDLDDVGVQFPAADFPNIRIENQLGGLIQTTGTASDDNDAINIAGNAGQCQQHIARECVEGTAVNCQVNLRIRNLGTIRSVRDNGGDAAITFEDDAVFNGVIINRGTGVIVGDRNGIRIGDVFVEGEALLPEHTGRVDNFGTIQGILASSRGIDLEGDGVEINNRSTGTIRGVQTGIEVGAGQTNDVDNSGLNNFIINSGVIEGGGFSVDSQNAEGALRILSTGGQFIGDIRGSVDFTDVLQIGAGETVLTHDVLQTMTSELRRPVA